MRIAGMDFPDGLAYDRNNGWLKLEGNLAVHGMTDLGQKISESIVFVGLPDEGQVVQRGQTLASFESSKWVGRIYALVSGRVAATNHALETNPALIHESPYDQGWFVKIEMADPSEAQGWLQAGSPEFASYVEQAAQQLA